MDDVPPGSGEAFDVADFVGPVAYRDLEEEEEGEEDP